MKCFVLQELPVALTAIPGVKCTPELLTQPVFKGKVMHSSDDCLTDRKFSLDEEMKH